MIKISSALNIINCKQKSVNLNIIYPLKIIGQMNTNFWINSLLFWL